MKAASSITVGNQLTGVQWKVAVGAVTRAVDTAVRRFGSSCYFKRRLIRKLEPSLKDGSSS